MAVTSTLLTVKLIDQSDKNATGDAAAEPRPPPVTLLPGPVTATYATPLRPWILEIWSHSLTKRDRSRLRVASGDRAQRQLIYQQSRPPSLLSMEERWLPVRGYAGFTRRAVPGTCTRCPGARPAEGC